MLFGSRFHVRSVLIGPDDGGGTVALNRVAVQALRPFAWRLGLQQQAGTLGDRRAVDEARRFRVTAAPYTARQHPGAGIRSRDPRRPPVAAAAAFTGSLGTAEAAQRRAGTFGLLGWVFMRGSDDGARPDRRWITTCYWRYERFTGAVGAPTVRKSTHRCWWSRSLCRPQADRPSDARGRSGRREPGEKEGVQTRPEARRWL